MADSVAAIVLGAGAGSRLRPLTDVLPKVLCPVGGVALVDHNLARVAAVVGEGPGTLAVNANHRSELVVGHLAGRAHVSVEVGEALGTAGGVAHLRDWLDGRAALVVNGDTWSTIDLAPLVEGWDGERVRVLVHGPAGTELMPPSTWARLREGNAGVAPGRPWRAQAAPGSAEIVASLVPAADVATLPVTPLGLSNGLWWPALAEGRLDVLAADGVLLPCDRPADYLAANLAASGGTSVVGEGAVVEGRIERVVVWPGGVVHRGESLVDAIRVGSSMTVLVR